ncbi:hypothetical protein ACFCX4_00285 [Kitasatospora sp. NPDC056327]|uniref:hypothetical protein n=1 Tax=Kitasatospora sp. NPDC056327 TaxID=3345785 RepID=UPI0035DBA703
MNTAGADGRPTRPQPDDPTEDDALFALEPGAFTKARKEAAARARAAGDRAGAARIRSLRRPTIAAFAVNRLARTHPDEVRALLELGRALRQAQEELAGPALRELSARRHRLVAALTAQARATAAEAGVRLGEAQLREVEQTLRAALASPQAADEVAAGRLSAAVEEPTVLPAAAAGGPVKKAGKAAAASRPGAHGGKEEREEGREPGAVREAARQEARRRVAEARGELKTAEQRERDAAQQRDRLAAQVEDLAARHEQAQDGIDRAQAVLRRAQDHAEGAAAVLTERRGDLDLATAEAAGAHAAAVRAREEYETARRAAEQEGER